MGSKQLAILAQITRSEASGKTGKAITDPGIGLPLTGLKVHTSVVGTTGSGKSTFLRNLALQAFLHGASVIIIEARRCPVHQAALVAEPAMGGDGALTLPVRANRRTRRCPFCQPGDKP
jgi:ABC-type uncharacterized transport system ATPase component